MENYLSQLSDLDHEIKDNLINRDINTEEILTLVDKRDQILQTLIDYASKNEQFAKSQQWQDAIFSTKQLVELMVAETSKVGEQLREFRRGQKSVQQYKKFL
jgi:flagellar protein FlaI